MVKTGVIGAVVVIIVVIVAAAAYIGTQPAAPSTTTPTTTAPTITTTTTTTPPQSGLRLALILDGYRDWPGWYTEAHQATLYVRDKYGVEVVYAEGAEFADQERVLNELAAEGYDLIWGHSGSFDFTLPPVAEKYPNSHFLISGGRFADLPNVISIDQAWRDTIFITGAIAASVSETNVVGFQVGEPYPTVLDMLTAFTAGAKYINPDISVLTSILGNWYDIEGGKEAALGMIDEGADFVGSWTGGADRGIGLAAQDRGVNYVAPDWDTYEMFTDIALGSTVYGFDRNVDEAIKHIIDGTWEGGSRLYGIASTDPPGQYIDHIFNESLLPSNVYDSIIELRNDVVAAGGVGMFLPSEDWWPPLAQSLP